MHLQQLRHLNVSAQNPPYNLRSTERNQWANLYCRVDAALTSDKVMHNIWLVHQTRGIITINLLLPVSRLVSRLNLSETLSTYCCEALAYAYLRAKQEEQLEVEEAQRLREATSQAIHRMTTR